MSINEHAMNLIHHVPKGDLRPGSASDVNPPWAAFDVVHRRDYEALQRDLDAIRDAWSVLKDWNVVPARISHDDRGNETWQAYAVIEAALLRPEDVGGNLPPEVEARLVAAANDPNDDRVCWFDRFMEFITVGHPL